MEATLNQGHSPICICVCLDQVNLTDLHDTIFANWSSQLYHANWTTVLIVCSSHNGETTFTSPANVFPCLQCKAGRGWYKFLIRSVNTLLVSFSLVSFRNYHVFSWMTAYFPTLLAPSWLISRFVTSGLFSVGGVENGHELSQHVII